MLSSYADVVVDDNRRFMTIFISRPDKINEIKLFRWRLTGKTRSFEALKKKNLMIRRCNQSRNYQSSQDEVEATASKSSWHLRIFAVARSVDPVACGFIRIRIISSMIIRSIIVDLEKGSKRLGRVPGIVVIKCSSVTDLAYVTVTVTVVPVNPVSTCTP
uniref:Uncharacterized protein n=1 Tax=Vespula pensylvanica TaxID=30213 RepID=A0A834P5T5_VESPE|nr:hypothetical protein H0235_005870 [Vespula pensylvanica]